MKPDNSKKIPHFTSEKAEAEFWAKHSPLDYPEEFKEVKPRFSTKLKKRIRPFKVGLSIQYDPRAHAAYIKIKTGKISKTVQKNAHFLLDLDKRGALLGIEISDPEKISSQERSKVLLSIAKHFKVSNLKHIHPEYVPHVFAA